jgi:hypothetical protein
MASLSALEISYFQHVHRVVFVNTNPEVGSKSCPKRLRKGLISMAEAPIVVLIGAGMILLGTLVAVWIVISIVRQNRKDRSFPE